MASNLKAPVVGRRYGRTNRIDFEEHRYNVADRSKGAAMWTTVLLLVIAASLFGQEARVFRGEEPPWPPAHGTLQFIVDGPPLPPGFIDKPPLERLCDLSDLVIDGVVATRLAARSPSRGTLQTDFLISISRVLKGPNTLRQVMVSQMGGTVGDFHLVTNQYALMQPGERYLLFLQNDNRPSTPRRPGIPPYSVTGIWSGLGRVVDERVQPGATAPGDLRSYDGTAVESLALEIQMLVSEPRR